MKLRRRVNSDVGWRIMMFSRTFPYLLSAMLCGGCAAPTTHTPSAQRITTPAPSPQQAGCGLVSNESPAGLRKTWDALLADGGYRFPQPSEFTLPPDEQPWPCHFGWSGELFAMVVDTTRSDNSRFKLVLLVPPENKNAPYKLYWVIHNHDLSHAILSNASSKLVVYEYLDNGGRRNSTLEWNKTKNAYVAMAS